MGHNSFVYLDNRFGSQPERTSAVAVAFIQREDLDSSGFLVTLTRRSLPGSRDDGGCFEPDLAHFEPELAWLEPSLTYSVESIWSRRACFVPKSVFFSEIGH